MKINRKKEILQFKLANHFLKSNGIGTFMLTTGTSKTRIALIVAEHLLKKGEIDKVLVLTPTQIIREDTWKNEIIKWLGKEYLQYFQIECIQSVYQERTPRQFIIADEIHNYIPNYDDFKEDNRQYVKFLTETSFRYLMGLSAYIPEKKRRTLDEICPILFKLEIDQAVKEGYVSNFRIFNIPIELNPEQREQYNYIEAKIEEYSKRLGGNIVAFSNANSLLKAFKGSNISDLSDSKKIKFGVSLKYIKLIGERKIFLSQNTNKIEVCNIIIDNYTEKCIVFSSSKEFSNIFADNRNDTVRMHSGVSKVKRKKLLELFRTADKTVKCLSAVNAINEGINVPKVKLGILANGNSTVKDLLQRLGRNLRLTEEESSAIFIQLYIKNTQDEKWTYNRIKTIDKSKIINLNNVQELLPFIKTN